MSSTARVARLVALPSLAEARNSGVQGAQFSGVFCASTIQFDPFWVQTNSLRKAALNSLLLDFSLGCSLLLFYLLYYFSLSTDEPSLPNAPPTSLMHFPTGKSSSPFFSASSQLILYLHVRGCLKLSSF